MKNNPYLKYLEIGITVFVVIAASILFYFIFNGWSDIVAEAKKIIRVLSPFIWGMLISYLLRPLLKQVEKRITLPIGEKIFENKVSAFKFGRAVAIAISILIFLLLISAIAWMIVPQLYTSIEALAKNSDKFINPAIGWGERVLKSNPVLQETYISLVDSVTDSVLDWAKLKLMPNMANIVSIISTGIVSVITGVASFFIGLIVSIYLLYHKEKVSSGSKRLLYSVFSVKASGNILATLRYADEIFMNFISGRVLDSTIIGILCYLGCAILDMPYVLLVATIVGITNIIPFFGPFIGGVPSTIIILTVSPTKALIFVVFIVILQQFDGNILGPKILGESMGLNGFWVMFAIILGAGVFGFTGMLIGVPIFMLIYTGVGILIERGLERRGLPVSHQFYSNLDHIDPETKMPVEVCPQKRLNARREEKKKAKEEKKKREYELYAMIQNITDRWRKKEKSAPEDSSKAVPTSDCEETDETNSLEK